MYALFHNGKQIIKNRSQEWLAMFAAPNRNIRVIFNNKYVLPEGYTIEEVKE